MFHHLLQWCSEFKDRILSALYKNTIVLELNLQNFMAEEVLQLSVNLVFYWQLFSREVATFSFAGITYHVKGSLLDNLQNPFLRP